MGRVALIGENSEKYISVLLDIWNHNDCAVLIDWRIPFETVCEMMQEALVKKCYIEKSIYDKYEPEAYGSIEYCVFDSSDNAAKKLSGPVRNKFHPNYSKKEAVIIYSSGTTGKSKGVILTHFAINTNADLIMEYMNLGKSDCLYIAKPLSHSSTLTGELLVSLKSGADIVVAPTIVPPRYVFYYMQKYHVTTLCLNPTLVFMFSREYVKKTYSLQELKTIYISGSILSDKIYEVAHKAFSDKQIYNVYGLSEAAPRVSAQRYGCCKNNSVGSALKNVKIAIVNSEGKVVPQGEKGILHVKTPCLYSGYVSGTAKHVSLYEDWLNTGDIGYIDKDNELHIVGRIDDIIILQTHKIHPNDIASEIQKHTNIVECIVVDVELNKENVLCCLYTSCEEIRGDIKKVLSYRLMKHEIPKIFIKTDHIIKNRNGKIELKLIRDQIMKELKGTN